MFVIGFKGDTRQLLQVSETSAGWFNFSSSIMVGKYVGQLFGSLGVVMRRCMFNVLSVGPIPNHLAFIMDGNRRYAKKRNLEFGAGHKAGFLSLISILKYCYELGVKYVTVFAFGTDNFNRRPEEVQMLMDLMLEKIEGLLEQESILYQYGVRVLFIGNLKLLKEPVRVGMEKAMKATANNTRSVLLVCVSYSSQAELKHAIRESCKDKSHVVEALNSVDKAYGSTVTKESEECEKISSVFSHDRTQDFCQDELDESGAHKASSVCNNLTVGISNGVIKDDEKIKGECCIVKMVDIKKKMYMAVAPDPDVLIRSSGETRLSNFLLWQTTNCSLYAPASLWPEMGLWEIVWATIIYQRNYFYFERKKKQL
ncbi:rubber cis-polyprenyltransferase HRT2 [Tripterygium wilfordii]|uniref:Alkyl transferase n=1 Tax=Tripterygium wilfordii TaxID=458696 RepID=A0A7J7CVK2_TRIWF|nr:rubber cis-polyprenyltransferase HRT2 [Tripterygium wilfordii]